MFPANPPAIVWTNIEPAYQFNLRDYAPTDIRAIQSWLQREADLSSLCKLGENWDGFDAAAPDDAIINKAISFLRILRDREPLNPPKRVVPSPNGLIALEWVEDNRFIQAEVSESDEVEWMVAIPGQLTRFVLESLSNSEPAEEQAWQPPATVAADEPAYASAR